MRFVFGNPGASHSSEKTCSLSEQNCALFEVKLWVGALACWNAFPFLSCLLHPLFLGSMVLCGIHDCRTFWSHRHSSDNGSQHALSKLDLFSVDDNYVLYGYMLMSLWRRIVRLRVLTFNNMLPYYIWCRTMPGLLQCFSRGPTQAAISFSVSVKQCWGPGSERWPANGFLLQLLLSSPASLFQPSKLCVLLNKIASSQNGDFSWAFKRFKGLGDYSMATGEREGRAECKRSLYSFL